jgi:DNA (cytosine-5)-methyltransferase 1
MPSTKVFSFFSGIGFLDLGFETSGFEVVYSSELSSDFTEAYMYAREKLNLDLPVYGSHCGDKGNIETLVSDQEKRNLTDLVKKSKRSGAVVGFIGGPPCPDFSVGGKNRGCEGDNGRLSGSYIELICQQNPDFFVFENVKGLWSNKRHRSFYEKLKFKLMESGYILSEHLINAIEYGVPQDRQRIILIGFQKSFISNYIQSKNEYLNISEIDLKWNRQEKFSRDFIFSHNWPTIEEFIEDSFRSCPNNILVELTAQYWFNKNDVLNHQNSDDCFKPRAGLSRFMSVLEGDDSRKSFKRLHRWRYSPTVCYGNNEVHLHPYKARRLSVAEALALQSLPKEFLLSPALSLTKMFKAIGNGVPYLASKAIANVIKDFLDSPYEYHQVSKNEQKNLFPLLC